MTITYPLASRMRPRCLVVVAAVVTSLSAHAQGEVRTRTDTEAEAPAPTLGAVEVKGQALLRSNSSPVTQTTFDGEQIREQGVTQPEQLFKRVPGMRVMTYGLGGVVNVISLRGFGGGAHGGDLGFVLDGIPLNEAISHADGYADLNVVIPLEIERVDVVKGPSSVLVGNYNRAGSIFVQTRKRGEYELADFTLGSFHTFDVQAAGGYKLGENGHLNLAAQVSTTNDFRPQSGYDRGTFSGRYTLDIDRGEISISGRAHRGIWDSASYLPLAQFQGGDPYGKSPLAQNDGGDKTFGTLRLDVARELSDQVKLLGFIYGTNQTYTRFFSRPVSATAWRQRDETYDRDVFGIGFSFNGVGRVAGSPLKWIAGAEHFRERTHYDYFDGTTQRARIGVPTARQDREYQFNSTGAFAQVELSPTPLFRPTLGLRTDRFTGSCDVLGQEKVSAGDPACNVSLKSVTHTSPKVGVRSTVARGVDLRASYNEGFQLANVRGLYAPTNDTQPNVFRQKEVGATFGPFADVRIDAALWRLDSNNEIREIPPGSGQFFNSGSTKRDGFDLSLLWGFARDWEASLAYGRVYTRIQDNPNPALIGKQLNGVPRDTGALVTAYAPERGFGAFAGLNRVGRYSYDSAGLNTLSYGGFTTVDAGVSWRGTYGGTGYKVRLNVYNVTDKVYASNVFQIGGQTLVAPAAPRSVQVGLQLDFK